MGLHGVGWRCLYKRLAHTVSHLDMHRRLHVRWCVEWARRAKKPTHTTQTRVNYIQ